MKYILFEDPYVRQLRPFSDSHPVFEILCGKFSGYERLLACLTPGDTLTLFVRNDIVRLVREKYPRHEVNPSIIQPGIWLNAASIWSEEILETIQSGQSYSSRDRLIAYNSDKRVSIQDVDVFLKEASMVTRKIDVDHLIYLWDAVFLAGKQINRDAIGMFTEKAGIVHPSVIMVNEEMIFLGRGSRINAGVVLDASEGPIIISDHVKIDIGALIKGPAVIGAKSVINPAARLRGNVILGPVCKVGGELEDVVIQGYSNKQHDGFLGHSYLGEWVNLGAGTNNSDLKNNYGKIRFDFGDDQVDSGLTFLGAMIGDYVKTGIATMLNTGTYIGTGANVFGGGFQRKHIPAFSWGENDRAQLSKFLKTCEIMKVRRGMILSETEKELLTACYGRMKPL